MITFDWGKISLKSSPEDKIEDKIKERFKDDFGTLLSEKTKDVTVIFQESLPSNQLQGIIIDKEQTKLFDFTCKISDNYTTSYTNTKTNEIINKA
ncbi:hypothetical protein [Desulfobacula sp.]|jgi:hypothetical protein|uniref:hypothetical protein n=1 Tax=Desulfobacula sp. TaxID=2593537 RepID=UPI001E056905|nr:hypothetical protein [Desulfobacula sp.]MBT4509152.1 hypothetical protein [Desulfobacula sp.]